jgi:hypothetical protein
MRIPPRGPCRGWTSEAPMPTQRIRSNGKTASDMTTGSLYLECG